MSKKKKKIITQKLAINNITGMICSTKSTQLMVARISLSNSDGYAFDATNTTIQNTFASSIK